MFAKGLDVQRFVDLNQPCALGAHSTERCRGCRVQGERNSPCQMLRGCVCRARRSGTIPCSSPEPVTDPCKDDRSWGSEPREGTRLGHRQESPLFGEEEDK